MSRPGHSRCGAVLATLKEMKKPSADRSRAMNSIVDRVRPSIERLLQAHSRILPTRLGVTVPVRPRTVRLRGARGRSAARRECRHSPAERNHWTGAVCLCRLREPWLRGPQLRSPEARTLDLTEERQHLAPAARRARRPPPRARPDGGGLARAACGAQVACCGRRPRPVPRHRGPLSALERAIRRARASPVSRRSGPLSRGSSTAASTGLVRHPEVGPA